MSSRRPFTIGLFAVLMLVTLRVAIGWHFFQEGLSHKNEARWSSEGFLRQAKGPLAKHYQAMAPGFHGRDTLLLTPFNAATAADPAKRAPPESSPVFGAWYNAIVSDWQQQLERLAGFYKFDTDQNTRLQDVLIRYRKNLGDVLAGYEDDIAGYRYQLYRTEQIAGGRADEWQIPLLDKERNLAAEAAREIPFLKSRIAKREQNPTREPGINIETGPQDWTADVQGLETALEREALALRSDSQRAVGLPPGSQTDLDQIDLAVTWLLIIGGGCLLVGLFTRLSALVLAVFLGSVIASQPAWIAGTVPTYFQCVEFIGLLVLASTRVGRWGGLDFFMHHLITRPLGWARD